MLACLTVGSYIYITDDYVRLRRHFANPTTTTTTAHGNHHYVYTKILYMQICFVYFWVYKATHYQRKCYLNSLMNRVSWYNVATVADASRLITIWNALARLNIDSILRNKNIAALTAHNAMCECNRKIFVSFCGYCRITFKLHTSI